MRARMMNWYKASLTALAIGASTLGCAEEKVARHGHGHEGTRQELGTTESTGLKLTATQVGKVEAGKEGIFEVGLPKDAKPPKAVRVWVGSASGEGSTKAK